MRVLVPDMDGISPRLSVGPDYVLQRFVLRIVTILTLALARVGVAASGQCHT